MSEYQFAAHIRAIAGKNALPQSDRHGLLRNGYAGRDPTERFRESGLVYLVHALSGRNFAGTAGSAAEFQTAVISLTGMEVGNCSLLDEATAAAEAMLMMYALRSREAAQQGRNILFVDENIFPQTFDLLLTRSEPFRHRNRLRQLRRVRVFPAASSGRSSSTRQRTERSAITTISPPQHTAGASWSPPWRTSWPWPC